MEQTFQTQKKRSIIPENVRIWDEMVLTIIRNMKRRNKTIVFITVPISMLFKLKFFFHSTKRKWDNELVGRMRQWYNVK